MTGLLLPMPRTAIVSARNREVSRDLLVVVLATGLTFAICAVFELREWLTEITRPLERYQIDELPFTLGAPRAAAGVVLLAALAPGGAGAATARRGAAGSDGQRGTLSHAVHGEPGGQRAVRARRHDAAGQSGNRAHPGIARDRSSATGRNLFDFYADRAVADEHRASLAHGSKVDVALLDLIAADGTAVKVIARMLVRDEPTTGAAFHVYVADISELQLMQRELADALAENRLLSQKYLLAQEEERRHLARELHDEMGQCLNAIKLDAVAIHRHPSELPRDVLESAQSIMEVSTRVYDVARGLMERLQTRRVG